MARMFPNSAFTGYDLSDEAIAWATAQAEEEEGLANLTFAVRDLRTYDRDAEPEAFDLVTTFDAIHDQGNPRAMPAGIRGTDRKSGGEGKVVSVGVDPGGR